MGLETGTFISDLDANNPLDSDSPSQGDDHLRLIKNTLLNTFAAVTGAVTPTHTELNYLDGVTGVTGTGDLVLDNSPTFTGTLTAAAVTATTYDGIAAADLVSKSSGETITGAWSFAAITATTYDGVAGSDLLDKSANETITGDYIFSTGIGVQNVDTVLNRGAAGKVEVEGKPIIAHNDAALSSGEIFVSTSGPSGGADGDIWLEREA